jgi:5-methylcytosine-specific restriction enzyme A
MPFRPPTSPNAPGAARGARDRARWNLAIRRLYRTQRWERERARVLAEAAYQCAECRRITLDLDVDHIRKHDGDLAVFWDRGNLQALCRTCHRNKTVRGE